MSTEQKKLNSVTVTADEVVTLSVTVENGLSLISGINITRTA